MGVPLHARRCAPRFHFDVSTGSAALVKAIWEAFAADFEEKFETRLSMKAASAHILEADAGLLGRWTNPGERRNWRIPLSRVHDFCRTMGATELQKHELMMARLAEHQADDPASNEVAAAVWAAELPEKLSQDEEFILKVWQETFPSWGHARLYLDEEESQLLAKAFRDLLVRASRLEDEESASQAVETPATEARASRHRAEREATALTEQQRLSDLKATRRKTNEAAYRKACLKELQAGRVRMRTSKA